MAWQLRRDESGQPLFGRILGGSTAAPSAVPDLAPGRYWQVETRTQETGSPSTSFSYDWVLDSLLNPGTGRQSLTGYVNGTPVNLPDRLTGQMFTRLNGIPNPADPANHEVWRGDPRVSATLSGSTQPGPVHIDNNNWLVYLGPDGARYGLSPDEYQQTGAAGSVQEGTGTYRQTRGRWGGWGPWEAVDPSEVPVLTGLWGESPSTGGDRRPAGGDPDRGPGTDPQPPDNPSGGPGDMPRTPEGGDGPGSRASLGSGPGPSVVPELDPVTNPLADIFAGDPLGPRVEPPDVDQPVGDPADPGEFDPNAGNRRTAPEPDLLARGPEGFPTRPDRQLEEALAPDGPGVFLNPPGREEVVSAGRADADESTGAPSPALHPRPTEGPGVSPAPEGGGGAVPSGSGTAWTVAPQQGGFDDGLGGVAQVQRQLQADLLEAAAYGQWRDLTGDGAAAAVPAQAPRPGPVQGPNLPVAGPVYQPQPEPGLLQRGLAAAQDLYGQLDAAGRESLRTTIRSSEALDGTLGFGVTRYRVTFMDDGRGIYDPEGNLLETERGNPPLKVPGWTLIRSGGGLGVPGPASPGGSVVPRLSPVFVR